MSAALRAGIALCAVSLVACDSILGLKDIVSDGAPTKLSFDSVMIKGVVQQPFAVLTVSVQDIQGRPAQGFSGEIKLTLGKNPGRANLIGAATATVAGSTAYFDALGIDRPAAGYTLVASADGLESATSGPIDVVAPPFTPIATGVSGAAITSVAVLHAPSGGTPTLLAGAGNGVYTSVDGGASWKPASFGGDTAARLVVDPKHPGVVYSGRPGPGFLKKSVDGGATWHRLDLGNSDLAFAYLLSFDLDPKDPSVIYTTDFRKLRRSADGGANWSQLSFPGTCQQIAIDPVTTSSLYCVVSETNTGQSLGVYKSSDSGATWGAVNSGLSSLNTGQLLATPNAIFVAAGGTLYRSTDAGTSWTSVSMTFPGSMAYAPSMPKRIYLAQGGAVSVSNDAGASFGPPVVVTPTESLQGLTVDPANADVVYAGGFNSGVFVSTNGGVSWSSSSTGIDAPQITSVAMASSVPGTVLTSIGRTVLRTTNSGTNWTTIVPTNATFFFATISFDPIVSTRVYLCGFNFFSTSTDGGASFSDGTNPDIFGCNGLAVAGATLFAAGNSRLYKSTNSGTTWADTGLSGPSGFFVNDVALGDGTGSVVVASTSQGLYHSTNGGTTFTQVSTDFTNRIVADPRAPTHVIAGQCSGFRISTDGGASFGSTIPGPCVQSLIATGSALYAAGSDQFGKPVLVTSTDGGSSWAPIEIAGGLPSGLSITSIAASDDGKTIYLGTPAGLYKSAGP
jgi:photosystem II stability/assembly factor-like uncharacterized protein